MARWFDDAARSAARRELAAAAHPTEGLTRRTVLTRGAVVAGVAWTAPLLMQTRAYAGASMCTSTQTPCQVQGSTLTACCTGTQTCQTDPTNGGPICIDALAPGGACGNSGVGVCTSSTGIKSNCNGDTKQCNNCARTYICGGEGAPCDATNVCGPGTSCQPAIGSTGTFCRKDCHADPSVCNSNQVCDSSGYCAEPCKVDSDCIGKETCVTDGKRSTKICNYDQK